MTVYGAPFRSVLQLASSCRLHLGSPGSAPDWCSTHDAWWPLDSQVCTAVARLAAEEVDDEEPVEPIVRWEDLVGWWLVVTPVVAGALVAVLIGLGIRRVLR